MSFEGYYQLICKKGHCYIAELFGDEEGSKCPFCMSNTIWWNLVDTTNDKGHPIKLKRKTKTPEETYYIPRKGHRV